MTRRILATAALAAVYAAMLESFAWQDFVTGLLLAAAVLAWVPPREGRSTTLSPAGRLAGAVPFAGVVAADALRGTAAMSAYVLGLRAPPSSGLVEIPIGARSDAGIVVTAWAATLSPGSVLIEVDRDRGVMVFHFADAADPDAIRAHQHHVYDTYQRHVVP